MISQHFLDEAVRQLRKLKSQADKALAQTKDDHLFLTLDDESNSIAIVMKHMAGNMRSRWTDFLTTDGEKPGRNRDGEFVDSFTSRAELLDYWNSGWRRLFDTLAGLSADDLAATVTIRGEPHSVPLAIQRSVAHCAYHVGQIILIARILAGENWTTITIPRGASTSFNQQIWGAGHYQTKNPEQT